MSFLLTCLAKIARMVEKAHAGRAQTQRVPDNFEWALARPAAVADALRPDAAATVAGLKRICMEYVLMLTSDNERVAAAIAQNAVIDEFHAWG
jgi:cation transport ATPase